MIRAIKALFFERNCLNDLMFLEKSKQQPIASRKRMLG
jgi:hypothetical protein